VHLPDELAERLAAEAARRGMSVDEVAAELLAASFTPVGRTGRQVDPLEAFIGSGDSGDPGWATRDTAELRRKADDGRAG
jgi:hypothetical protein